MSAHMHIRRTKKERLGSFTPASAKWERLINRLTQHQRTLWARAGHPGLLKKNAAALHSWAAANIDGWKS